MRIAIQGELGSFSHQAALRATPEATIIPCMLSVDAFDRLRKGEVDAIMIPIENTLAGSVVEHYDLLREHPVFIERETVIRIEHHVIGFADSNLEEVQRIYSHPVALAQCRRFFSQHPAMTPTPFYDTAGSVKHIVSQENDGRRDRGAIASEQTALTYGGEVLAAEIEDNPANYTRFFLIRNSSQVRPLPNPDKVSIAFTVENRPGTLVSALQVFADHKTNLCKVESRPVQGQPWQYVFYLDYQTSDQEAAGAALEELRRQCLWVKELGRYPAAPPLS